MHKAYAVKIQEKKRLKQSVKGQGYNRAGGRWLKNNFRRFSTDFRETERLEYLPMLGAPSENSDGSSILQQDEHNYSGVPK